MTSCAMIAGMVPMALALGEGGEQTAPLGRAVIGGLVAATLATLVRPARRVRRGPGPESDRVRLDRPEGPRERLLPPGRRRAVGSARLRPADGGHHMSGEFIR